MTMRVTWVLSHAGWSEGAWAAGWAAQALMAAGVAVSILPLWEPEGPAMGWPAGVTVERPVWTGRARWSRKRRLAERIPQDTRIIVDQDFRVEHEVWGAAPGGPLWLFVRHADWPPEERSWAHTVYPQWDRIVAGSAPALRLAAHVPGVLPSRLYPMTPPLLLGEEPAVLAPSGPTLAIMGALTAVKGVDMVLNALAELLHHRDRHFRLVLLGDGPERRRVETYGRAMGVDVHVVTAMDQWADVLQQVDAVLAPQFRDGLGWDAVAARSRGIPVVTGELAVMHENLGGWSGARWVSTMTVMGWVEALEVPLPERGPAVAPERPALWSSTWLS